jgi:hypothetical protein
VHPSIARHLNSGSGMRMYMSSQRKLRRNIAHGCILTIESPVTVVARHLGRPAVDTKGCIMSNMQYSNC